MAGAAGTGTVEAKLLEPISGSPESPDRPCLDNGVDFFSFYARTLC